MSRRLWQEFDARLLRHMGNALDVYEDAQPLELICSALLAGVAVACVIGLALL